MRNRSRVNRRSGMHQFCVPNQIFDIGLSTGELVVYFYLLRCKSSRTNQCWPSYSTIGEAVGMSKNTVKKYVGLLLEKELIYAEPTEITTRTGLRGNGNLLYTILPFQDVVNRYERQQLMKLEQDVERTRIQKILAERQSAESNALANDGEAS